jgi:4-hydroxybenzoate polyprenyltransferase
MTKTLNYIGQLRLYSLVDLIVFATALTQSIIHIFAITCLWISFLAYLESKHKDPGRYLVPSYLWVIMLIPPIILLPIKLTFLFIIFSFLYTAKKRHGFFAVTSPLWRGLQNMTLALFINPSLALYALITTFARNLLGDFRDVEVDAKSNTYTIPVLLGVKNNQVWAYFAHLFAVIGTTMLWLHFSYFKIPLYITVALILVQLGSYHFTPRASNVHISKYLPFRKLN